MQKLSLHFKRGVRVWVWLTRGFDSESAVVLVGAGANSLIAFGDNDTRDMRPLASHV